MFFKTLFSGENSFDEYRIVLPNYSTASISALIQFFYTGEILINESSIEEFACLCHEFNCEEIPAISELVKNYRNGESNRVPSEAITRTIDAPKVEMEFDEYFESNDNVETIFFNENESEFLERGTECSQEKSDLESNEVAEVKEEYLNVQYIEEGSGFEIQGEKSHEEFESKKQKTPNQIEPLEEVDESPERGLSFQKTQNKHKDSKTVTFRPVEAHSYPQKSLKRLNASPVRPSMTFPVLPINLHQLREEQNRFKKRLQMAINYCRDNGSSTKKASKMFGVPLEAIERNLRGFKNNGT